LHLEEKGAIRKRGTHTQGNRRTIQGGGGNFSLVAETRKNFCREVHFETYWKKISPCNCRGDEGGEISIHGWDP